MSDNVCVTQNNQAERASENSARAFHLALKILALVAIAVNVYVFFLPYNTIADEEEYLGEVFSSASGHPQGWNIRHLLYPILLSPFVASAQTLGVDVPSLALVARLANWLMWWLGLFFAFGVTKRLFDHQTAWIAVILIAFNWVWMLSGKRLMMDVPSSVWLLAAIYCHLRRNDWGLKALMGGLFCAAMATVTKFQMGPMAALYGLFILMDRLFSGRRADAAIGLAFSLIIVGGIGVVDRLTYGVWFSSLLEFRQYNLSSPEEFAAKYGSCEHISYYLLNTKDVFSYLVFPLALIGLARLLFLRPSSERMLFFLIVLSYLIVLHLVCHKQARYLISILPQISILAASSFTFFLRKALAACRLSLQPAILGAAISGIVLIIYSLVPRNDLQQTFATREACADFVYEVSAALPRGSTLVLAAPCGMPTFFLSRFNVAFGDLGFNNYTRQTELEKFRGTLENADAVVVERGNPLDKELQAQWKREAYSSDASPSGQYAIHIRNREGKR